ncbi:SDR family NAD(P)-dependent oxidoreductase [Streptomyces sp. URMC 123]|uniref:SDR family NAD(P)-dependent oxidoreductase n=1 Tax=Streptomyces sp. URMC 123 TaxID=3423403 RepID=UPI003F1CF5BF
MPDNPPAPDPVPAPDPDPGATPAPAPAVGLAGRVALVTGAAGGLGAAIARALYAHGARVALLDTDARRNEETARAIDPGGDRTLPVVADLSDPAAGRGALAAVEKRWGGVDILVNNAARAPGSGLWDITPEEWDAVFDVNLRGTFFLTRAVAAGMRRRGRGGRVINMASIAGQTARPTGAHYGASKAGLIALTRVFAAELAADGITVNAVSPAMIDTPMVRSVGERALAELTARVPLGRIATPEEVAALVVHLAGDQGAFITGATYDINGGALMR